MATVTGLVLLFAFTAGGVIWLARDVDRAVSNRTAAQSIAFQAARSGAQQIVVAGLRGDGVVAVDGSRARAAAAGYGEALVGSNRALREGTLAIFDRTFAITAVLQLLATVVAFIGILSALMALQLERARELGMLRANGLTPGQLWGVVLAQTGLMGLTAGLLAAPLGLALSLVLVYVINRRSFGWSMELVVTSDSVTSGMTLALAAALLAGVYPAWRASRVELGTGLRED